ncbi:MAG TPA: tetratricopeptide repeat protein [Chloroflexota bacterium]
MALFQSEDRLRLRRIKSEQAINLAMQNDWEKAVVVNREILELFPDDVDAYNRLGKALMELGRYQEASDAYAEALKRDPLNTIAQRNRARLEKLIAEQVAAPPPPGRVDPALFIEESGKTIVTTLVDVAPADVIARVTAGDQVELQVRGNIVQVADPTGEVIGRIEPKLAQRLIRLLRMGNQYTAAVTGVDDQTVRVIVRETYRHPSMGDRPSFPVVGAPEVIRGYLPGRVLQYDLEEEEEEEYEEAETEMEPIEAELVGEEPAVAEEPELEEET